MNDGPRPFIICDPLLRDRVEFVGGDCFSHAVEIIPITVIGYRPLSIVNRQDFPHPPRAQFQ
jgi:hypothetical protein